MQELIKKLAQEINYNELLKLSKEIDTYIESKIREAI